MERKTENKYTKTSISLLDACVRIVRTRMYTNALDMFVHTITSLQCVQAIPQRRFLIIANAFWPIPELQYYTHRIHVYAWIISLLLNNRKIKNDEKENINK